VKGAKRKKGKYLLGAIRSEYYLLQEGEITSDGVRGELQTGVKQNLSRRS
jgi:hypothetical protein